MNDPQMHIDYVSMTHIKEMISSEVVEFFDLVLSGKLQIFGGIIFMR